MKLRTESPSYFELLEETVGWMLWAALAALNVVGTVGYTITKDPALGIVPWYIATLFTGSAIVACCVMAYEKRSTYG